MPFLGACCAFKEPIAILNSVYFSDASVDDYHLTLGIYARAERLANLSRVAMVSGALTPNGWSLVRRLEQGVHGGADGGVRGQWLLDSGHRLPLSRGACAARGVPCRPPQRIPGCTLQVNPERKSRSSDGHQAWFTLSRASQ